LTHPSQSARLVLIGGGGHALVVAEAAMLAGLQIAGVLDDEANPVVCADHPGLLRLGSLMDLDAIAGHTWIIAVGGLRDQTLRRTLIGAIQERAGPEGSATGGSGGGRAATIVHPSAHVSPSARVGPGVYVGPGAVVHTRARVGPHAIVNSGAIVEHECVLGANAHVAPGAVLGGRTRVGVDALVGIGARVLPGLTIGDRSVVAAGAVAIRDVPPGSRVAGVPARSMT